MLDRRAFLRRSSLALAGGLLVGDQALELFERLTFTRTMFPSARMPSPVSLDELCRRINREVRVALAQKTEEYDWVDGGDVYPRIDVQARTISHDLSGGQIHAVRVKVEDMGGWHMSTMPESSLSPLTTAGLDRQVQYMTVKMAQDNRHKIPFLRLSGERMTS